MGGESGILEINKKNGDGMKKGDLEHGSPFFVTGKLIDAVYRDDFV